MAEYATPDVDSQADLRSWNQLAERHHAPCLGSTDQSLIESFGRPGDPEFCRMAAMRAVSFDPGNRPAVSTEKVLERTVAVRLSAARICCGSAGPGWPPRTTAYPCRPSPEREVNRLIMACTSRKGVAA